MRVLITIASRHGATRQVAETIAATLRDRGADVGEVTACEEVRSLDGVDAVVLGSAVYLGRWLTSATRLLEHLREPLRERPVWLFSSGPLGEPPFPDGDPTGTAERMALVGARGHRTFPGRLTREGLGPTERLIVAATGAPTGDFRDDDEVRRWAERIADELALTSQQTPQPG